MAKNNLKANQYLKNREKNRLLNNAARRQKAYKIGAGDQAGSEAGVIVAFSKNNKVKKYIKLFDRHTIIR